MEHTEPILSEQRMQLIREDLEKTKHEYVHKEGGGYRPNGVFILYQIVDQKPLYLLTLANNPTVIKKDKWFLAQGGVGVDPLEEDESLEDNLFQEARTELGIDKVHLNNIKIGIVDPFDVDYIPGRTNIRNKNNPEKGKRYYITSAEYSGSRTLECNDEISQYRWVDYDDVVRVLSHHADEKSIHTLEALNIVHTSITSQNN